MNDAMANAAYNREPAKAHRATREQDRSTLRRDSSPQSEFNWIKDKRSLREMVLYWRDFVHSLYSSLTKPRLPKGYYAFIENLGLKRGEAIFLIALIFASGRMSFIATTNLINNMPEVEIITPAQASEHLPISNIHTKEDLGEFLEDCY